MRIRSIKPDFFKDDELAALPPLTRILFEGLWCLADGEGRLEDRPVRIKVEVLPYDECNVDEMLDSLHEHEFITRYEVGSKGYVEVRSFRKHQRISGKEAEAASLIPPVSHGEAMVKQRGSNGEAMVHEQGSTHCPGKEGKGMERKGSAHVNEPSAPFSEFWTPYPRKVGKGRAEAAWSRMTTLQRTQAIDRVPLFACIWANAPEDRRTFIPHPATWLSQKRWEDDPDDWRRQTRGQAQARPAPTLIGAHKQETQTRDIGDAPEDIREIHARLRRREATDDEVARLDEWVHGGAQ